jgi:hypothetical protein
MNPIAQAQAASLEQVRLFARLVTGVECTDTQRVYQVTPGSSHMTYLLGHVALAIDAIAVPALGGSPRLPKEFAALFMTGIKPEPDASKYPRWDALKGELEKSLDHLASVVGALTDRDLADPLPVDSPLAKFLPARVGVVPFVSLHTTYHLGQISTLRRAQGLASGIPM